MAHITGKDRSQLLLLPDTVGDYVGPDNPVRFIDAFVDSLDLEAAGFMRVRPNDIGRPGYDPADLLKLYIYGYLNRVRSSRRLEAETHRNLEVIWLLRRLTPDFKTIADFRRDNRKAFRQVFRAFVRLCRELDLYGRELIAVDGTRIKAVNHRDRNFTETKLKKNLQCIGERLDRYLDQMNEADADEAGSGANAVAGLEAKIASLRKRKETLEGHQQDVAPNRGNPTLTDGSGLPVDARRERGRRGLQRPDRSRYPAPPDRRAAGSQQGLGPGPACRDGDCGTGEPGC